MPELQERTTPVTVRISSTSGRLVVKANGSAPVSFDGRAEITHTDGVVTIDGGSGSLGVSVPEGADVFIGSISGRVDVTGRAGDVAVVTTSGRVRVEAARSVDVRTKSGRVEVGEVELECCARSTSGRVVVERCGSADLASRSGQIRAGNVHGPVGAHCVSGRISIGLATAADVTAETLSGRIEISVPAGVRVHRTSTVPPIEPRPADTDCVVAARSGSGRVEITTR
ncbi:MAG: DUF4097 family beta strand repeat-containing protein [Acidimicrobiia bacterium]|nr:DUF4097 family beta strand repeat-containing protein [Acidimicrobiia bacterium]